MAGFLLLSRFEAVPATVALSPLSVAAWLGFRPSGFRRVRRKHAEVWVREDLDRSWQEFLFNEGWRLRKDSLRLQAGRGGVFSLVFEGREVVAREYLHGGLRANFFRKDFLGRPKRPLRELVLTEEARKRGVPTVEVLAVKVCRSFGPFYRGTIVTLRLPRTRDLWSCLRENPMPFHERQELLLAVGRLIRQMHGAGLYHGDLNLSNLLVENLETGKWAVFVLDLDRSRLGKAPLSGRLARRNLSRFSRSARKLDPEGRTISDQDLALVRKGYGRTE